MAVKIKNSGKSNAQTRIEQDYQQRISEAQAANTQAYNRQREEQERLADQQIAQAQKTRDAAQNQNYINYMMNQKNLPAQLARLGLTGGAAESSQLRANTNYENAQNATNSDFANAQTNINNTLTAALAQAQAQREAADANARQTYNEKMMAAVQAQKEREEEQKRQADEKERASYENTIRRYDTIKKVDEAIRRAQKRGYPKWKIRLLQAQRADLLAAEKANGGGSSSSSRSYGYSRGSGRGSGSGSGSGGGGNTPKKPKKNEVAWNKAVRTATGLTRNVLKNLF